MICTHKTKLYFQAIIIKSTCEIYAKGYAQNAHSPAAVALPFVLFTRTKVVWHIYKTKDTHTHTRAHFKRCRFCLFGPKKTWWKYFIYVWFGLFLLLLLLLLYNVSGVRVCKQSFAFIFIRFVFFLLLFLLMLLFVGWNPWVEYRCWNSSEGCSKSSARVSGLISSCHQWRQPDWHISDDHSSKRRWSWTTQKNCLRFTHE